MSTSLKNKWLVAGIILLLLLNIATIALLWTGKPKQMPPRQRGDAAEFIINEVGFDAAQQRQYHSLIDEHQKNSRALRDEIKIAKDKFFDQLSTSDSSDQGTKDASAEVMKRIQQLDMTTFEHFKQVRAICRPDQQKKFDAIIHNAIGLMGPRPPDRP
jgi:protein CpxP